MALTIPDAVRQLLAIVDQLCVAFPKKKFTLDGRLVGDIGEVLVEDAYDIELFAGLTKHHDAKCSDGRFVQVKATMKQSLTFPADHVPDYYLAVSIRPDGSWVEVFNGPGSLVPDALAKRAAPKTNLHTISIGALRKLQERVRPEDRIPRRSAR